MKRGYAAQFGERLNFRYKKDLIFYLNSSHAAGSGEFKFKLKKRYKLFYSHCTYPFCEKPVRFTIHLEYHFKHKMNDTGNPFCNVV
jgi:hypothetical protein